jgi:vancomycin resistance protein YoaR
VPSLSEGNVQSFAFHPGQNGVSLDSQAMAAAIMQRLAEGEFAFEMQPITTEVSPTFSEQEIQDYTKRIATFTTRFRNSTSMQIIKNRVFNIQKAADIINCMTVEPGSEWSFNTFVGLRTAEGGWKEANGISGGKEYTLQVGGGICQVSTTLYNALLRANIKITDRRAHSIPSDYVDKGLDATVDSGGIDLKFQNDTGYPLYVFAYLKPDPEDSRYATITVSLYGKPLSGGVTYQPRSEISEVIPRDVPAYTEDPNIPSGYQLETVARHDGFVAEVYLDKYVNGAFESSTHLYRDKYRGNVAEISLGTGDPAITGIPENAVPVTGGTGGIPAQTPAVPEPTPTPPPEAAPDMTPNPDGSLG